MQNTQTVQQRLDAKGVEDVKFLFRQDNQPGLLASVVLSDVENVLTRYLNDECEELPPFKEEISTAATAV